MSGIGDAIEALGWLQGSIIDKKYSELIFSKATCVDLQPDTLDTEDFVFIVATQSCNLANNDVPTVQLCIARKIECVSSNFSYNKHPRLLDIEYSEVVGEEEADVKVQPVRLNALEKVFIPKEILFSVDEFYESPILDTVLRVYVDWLGAHYTKPALPTSFNNQLKKLSGSQQKKQRKKQKAMNGDFSGLYVKLLPNRELETGEQYSVQLFGVVTADTELEQAQKELDEYAAFMTSVGMSVKAVARSATKVSLASLNGFNRLYLDDLSYGNDEPLPSEVEVSGITTV